MPSQYVFMFPVTQYLEEDRLGTVPDDRISYLFELVDARYRQQGYQVNWVVFDGEPLQEQVPAYADIREEDAVLPAGVSQDELNTGTYPDPDTLLDRVVPAETLVVGGFHLYDCVERVAERAWDRGLEPFVDEETTEALLYTDEEVPLVREDWSLAALGLDDWYIRERRKEKPWLPGP